MKANFASESEMCADFIKAAPPTWTAYPETCGFDLVLVHETGLQIGVEAKLQFSAKVLEQALPKYPHSSFSADRPGPDYRAILIPGGCKAELKELAFFLGITVIRMFEPTAFTNYARFNPPLPLSEGWQDNSEWWPDWAPAKRLALPDYIPDVAAGSSAPVRLTNWKIGAIKIQIMLERRGYVTPADFKRYRVSSTRWTQPPKFRWLDPMPGERGRWIRTERLPDLRKQHPKNFAQIEADYEKWGEQVT